MAPRLDAGESWPQVLSNYMEQMREQMMTPARIAQTFQSTNELWGLYFEQIQLLTRPYVDALRRTPGSLNDMMTGGEHSALTDLYWTAYQETFGRLVNTPGVGLTRELQQKLLEGFGAWTEYRRAVVEYQIALSGAWEKIYEQVLQEMMKRAENGTPIETIGDLIRLWTSAADRGLEQVFRAQDYVDAQNNMVNASMRYRIHEQQIVETFMQGSYVPTRSEVDEAHRNIYQLRREVRALKKTIRQLTGNAVTSDNVAEEAAPAPSGVVGVAAQAVPATGRSTPSRAKVRHPDRPNRKLLQPNNNDQLPTLVEIELQ
ncbi:MAG: hypothetical protein HC893_11680 [Chloroflexaceae bacterium]|nr:hypothetical protein [Chloroflexaceae bacterium]